MGRGKGDKILGAWYRQEWQWCLPNIDKVITFYACWLAHTNPICVRDCWEWKEKFVVACPRCRWNVKFGSSRHSCAWRQGNVQKNLVHVLSCCFANLNLMLFWRFRCCRRSDILTSLLLSYGTVDFSYSISKNNWKCGFFLTLFPYFWRKGAIP